LSTAMFSRDRNQAPIGRLICLTRRNIWKSRKIAEPARKLAKGFTPQA
jgi:hypothetical protein